MNIELEIISGTSIFMFALYFLLLSIAIAVVCRSLLAKLTPPKVFGALIFINGPDGKELPSPISLRNGRMKTIGKNSQCDIVLEDDGVEDFHAQLYAKKPRQMYLKPINGKVIIKDFILNVEKHAQAQEEKLPKGTVFKIGEYEIQWT